MGAVLLFLFFSGESGPAARLAPFDAGLPRDGQWRQGFALADMNGDGHIDLAHGPARKGDGRPVIFLGDGAGSWRVWSEAAFPEWAYDYGDAAAGDFDGDGHADLALAMHHRGLVLLTGDGSGRFAHTERALPTGSGDEGPAFSSRAIAAVDWNRDGRLDLAVNGEGPFGIAAAGGAALGSRGLRVYLNGSDGWDEVSAPGARSFGDGAAIGDFNGDGWPDAIASSNVMGDAAVVAMNDSGAGWRPAALPGLPERAVLTAVAAGDFDGDGRDEAAAAWTAWDGAGARRHGLSLFRLTDGLWTGEAVSERLASAITALAPGDADGDGAVDLASGTDEGAIALWRGDGRGGLAAVALAEAGRGAAHGRCYGLAFADIDGDGADELAASFAREPGAASPLSPANPSGESRSSGAIRIWKLDFGPLAVPPSPTGDAAP